MVGAAAVRASMRCGEAVSPDRRRCDEGNEAMVTNGILATSIAAMWSTLLSVAVVPALAVAAVAAMPQGGDEELTRLRGQLQQSGVDGRPQRDAAIEQLLALPGREAHFVLQAQLSRREDLDGLRASILAALQRHLLGVLANQFGGANADVRRQILVGYLGVLSPWWAEAAETKTDDLVALRPLARTALQRVPARDLDAAARVLLASGDATQRCCVLACLGDMQQTLFAATVAEWLEHAEEPVRLAAVASLQSITYADETIRTRAQFEVWQRAFGELRYVDLAERAARVGSRARQREELLAVRVHAARDVVQALVVRTPGIDWAAVQARTIAPEPEVLEACLKLLLAALQGAVPPEEQPMARQAFCRALLQRYRQAAVPGAREGLLLEVAACLARHDEVELANEVVVLLLQQLQAGELPQRLAALRALRRFPSAETRKRLVQSARALVAEGTAASEELTATLATMASRGLPRWSAPLPDDADKADWLALVFACCRAELPADLREAALALAQSLDARERRVPEVFELLLGLVRDVRNDTKFRSACLIHLQSWRNEPEQAPQWVRSLHALLVDATPELRVQAAASLSQLVESTHPLRGEWITATIQALRGQLAVEADAAVLRDLVECMQVLGREPQMPEKAIGALLHLVAELGDPVPTEQQFRLEPLLQALTTIAADARAERGQWVSACGPLLQHRKRQSLRLILQNHSAADAAKDIASQDATIANRARQAMQLLVDTALLKPERETWAGSKDLVQEVRDVRAAFAVLDSLGAASSKDSFALRQLRLELDLAAGKFSEAAQRGTAWLVGGGAGAARLPMQPEQMDRLRVLVAEAQLGLGTPAVARDTLAGAATTEASAGRLELEANIARALADSELPVAVQMLERVVRATAVADPAFRTRLVDWLQLRLRMSPESRSEVAQEAARHAAAFASSDCPAELRAAFELLRSPK